MSKLGGRARSSSYCVSGSLNPEAHRTESIASLRADLKWLTTSDVASHKRGSAVVKVPTARILVIDDYPGVVDILAISLREEGYGVSGALTGDEGLKLFASSSPDLVLLDIALSGGMSGVEVLKRIRSIDPAAKVVMVTGNTDPQRARAALELGALAYVDKPFNFAYLKRVIAVALQTGGTQSNEHSTA